MTRMSPPRSPAHERKNDPVKQTKFIPQPYWLLHHGILLEWTTEPPQNRRDYIDREKPENERAIRQEWMRPVKTPKRLPLAVRRADAACSKADAAWSKAYAVWSKATEEHWDEIVALHKEECPGCPFDYENKTLIFPKS